MLKEKRAAEKQAKDDYDPSTDNLMQIFGIMKPSSKQKLPKVQKETKSNKKSNEKKRFQSKESSRNHTNRKKQLTGEVYQAALELAKRRNKKKIAIKEKLYKL